MSTAPFHPETPAERSLRGYVWMIGLILLYGGLHLLWYWQTPLGQVPVLDERENLDLARLLASGALPAEPFYRSLGYPLFLAPLYLCGLPASLIPFVATAAGLLLHAAAALTAAFGARALFDRTRAGLIAGLLYGLNPVLLHQATQILDGALANLALLLGLLCLLHARRTPRITFTLSLGAALAWSLAALVRPQLLLVWLAFPVLWTLLSVRTPDCARRLRLGALAMIASALPWLALGLVQSHVSGHFRCLPTQGAYNLWAANRPGAHGRFFAQSITLPAEADRQNPTRYEAAALFTQATGQPASDIDTINAYWSARLRETVLADPAGFIGRIARRAYYLFNDTEQYNNKTYSFHKARSPLLRFNPLGWGLVFLAGLTGLAVLATRDRRSALVFTVLIGTTTAAILVAFVSDRFRLPLVALASLLAGGVLFLPATWTAWSRNRRLGFAAFLVLAAAFTFSRAFNVRDDATVLQDHLLLASAAVQTGDDALAWSEAGAALALAPGKPDALAWRVTAYFNRLLTHTAPADDAAAWTANARDLLAQPASPAPPSVEVIAALALWRAGDTATAEAAWRRLVPLTPDARAALVFARLTPASELPGSPLAPNDLRSAGALTQLALALAAAPRDATLVALARDLFFPTPVHP